MIASCKTFEKPGITLVLSGHISGHILPFWRSFIQLQARLPVNKAVRQVVAHSFNPELTDLVKAVYAPHSMQCDHWEVFYAKALEEIGLEHVFGLQAIHAKSASKDKPLQSVLCSAYSRARATQLMDQLPIKKGQVLFAYWDSGGSSPAQLNQIIVDTSLPEDYCYLSYSSEIDMGYPDGWMLAPWKLARRFGGFYQFVLDALSSRNEYLELFTQIGWPRARTKSHYENFLLYFFGSKLCTIITKIIQDNLNCLKGDNFFRRILRRSLRSIYLVLTWPPVTSENSCLADFKKLRAVFPKSLALNIRSLLKYFILFNGFRDRVRFLTKEDFEITSQSGQIINPQQLILVVYEGSESLLHLSTRSPLPLAAVYQMADGLVYEYLPDGRGNWISTIFQPLTSTLKDQMFCVIGVAEDRFDNSMPLLLMPSVDQYCACVDWFYLNALMKYIVWKGLDYVALDSPLRGKPHLEFPDIYVVLSSTFSFFSSAGTVGGIRKLLATTTSQSLMDGECESEIYLEFPVVSKDGGLFERFDSVST